MKVKVIKDIGCPIGTILELKDGFYESSNVDVEVDSLGEIRRSNKYAFHKSIVDEYMGEFFELVVEEKKLSDWSTAKFIRQNALKVLPYDDENVIVLNIDKTTTILNKDLFNKLFKTIN